MNNTDQQAARIETALEQLTHATSPDGINAIMQAYIDSVPQPVTTKPRRSRIIAETRGDRYSRSADVPFIRIRGRWLERAGFNVGDDLSITLTADGALVLKRAVQPPTLKCVPASNI